MQERAPPAPGDRRREQGLAVLILLMGSMDVDVAIVTVGGLRPDAIAPLLAAIALAGTILANMSVKLGITLAYARSQGISAALALGASMAVLAATIACAGAPGPDAGIQSHLA
mgnify:CR=1 FL=1